MSRCFLSIARGQAGGIGDERQWVDAAVWRYHPTEHRFEVFAEGTSNPWGVDFDERGQCWIEACVIPHLWHMIQGGRYQRQGGAHYSISLDETARNESHREVQSRKPVNPHIYADLQTTGIMCTGRGVWARTRRMPVAMRRVEDMRMRG
jgi:hypothetical protein